MHWVAGPIGSAWSKIRAERRRSKSVCGFWFGAKDIRCRDCCGRPGAESKESSQEATPHESTRANSGKDGASHRWPDMIPVRSCCSTVDPRKVPDHVHISWDSLTAPPSETSLHQRVLLAGAIRE